MLLINFPLMLVPFAVYNFFILAGDLNPWENIVLRVDMMSGSTFTLTMGEGLVVLALALLFVEILKATRTGTSTIIDLLPPDDRYADRRHRRLFGVDPQCLPRPDDRAVGGPRPRAGVADRRGGLSAVGRAPTKLLPA
jgi:hypothetical protein